MALAFDADLGSAASAASLTTSAAAASGSRVIVFLWWFDATANLTGGSWGGGLTWVADHQFRGSGGGDQCCGIASADAPSGLASSTSITPTFSAAVDFGPAIAAVSFTGVETGASGYIDVTSTGKDDFEETWTTNNLVTTNADDLLVAISVQDPLTDHAATSPATEIHDWLAEGAQNQATVYRIVSSTGTYTIGGVWSGGTVNYQNNIGAAYKAAGAAAEPQLLNPDADTDAASWTTTPLFSKVNDASDATVISDTLA